MEFSGVDGGGLPPRTLYAGDSFGEEILSRLEERYTYTVVAASKASLHCIGESGFQRLFEHMPDIKDQVIHNADEIYSDLDLKRRLSGGTSAYSNRNRREPVG